MLDSGELLGRPNNVGDQSLEVVCRHVASNSLQARADRRLELGAAGVEIGSHGWTNVRARDRNSEATVIWWAGGDTFARSFGSIPTGMDGRSGTPVLSLG